VARNDGLLDYAPTSTANGIKLLQNAGLIDTGDFGESGTGRKTQDGMLIGMPASARETKLSGSWNERAGRRSRTLHERTVQTPPFTYAHAMEPIANRVTDKKPRVSVATAFLLSLTFLC